MAKRLAIVAIPLLLVVGFLVLRAGLGAGDERDPTAVTRGPALAPREASPVESGGEMDVPEQVERDEARSLAAATPEASAGSDFDRERAVWVEGRVAFPAGSPPDETLAVVAFAGVEEAGEEETAPWWRERADDAGAWSRAEVAPDGGFRVALPEGTARAELLLDGRHLYLAAAHAVELPARESVVLEPELGGCIVLRCVPPAAAENGPAELVGTEVTLVGADAGGGWFGMMGGGSVQRELRLEEDLVAEFRGLPSGLSFIVGAEPELFDSARLFELEVGPGATLEERLAFDLGARLSGLVQDARGEPVEGARVEARFTSQFAGFMGGERRSATTGADGRFDLRGVHPRRLQVRATKDGWISAETEELGPRDGEELRGLRLVLDRGHSIAGALRFPDGSPAAGARVTLTPTGSGGDRSGGGRPRSGESDAEGGFELSGLEADGTYDVVAVAAGSALDDVDALVATLEDVPADIFEELSVDEPSPAPAAPSGRRGWRAKAAAVPAGTRGLELVLIEPEGLKGLVVGPDGSPLTSFEVTANLQLSELGRGGSVSREVDDPEGRFLLPEVYAGEWNVAVEAPGLVTEVEELRALVPQAQELRVEMVRASGASGVVLDPDGQPAAGAEVRLTRGRSGSRRGGAGFMFAMQGGSNAQTDAEGRFLVTDLRPGKWTLRATHEDWAPSPDTELELLAGVVSEGLVVTLGMGGTLTGEIYDASGAPDAGRTIMAMSMGSGSQGSGSSDEAGRFRIERLAPGQYTVMAQPGLSMLSEMEERDEDPDPVDFMSSMKMTTADITEGGETHVVLGAPPKNPVRLHGRVTEAGEPVGTGSVMVVAEGRSLLEAWKPARVRADGSYEIVLDEPGNVLVTYQERGFEGAGIEYFVRVPEAEEHRFDLELPTGRIAGVVVGPDGAPVEGQRVTLERESGLRGVMMMGGQNGETTDERGHFAFTRRQPGTYTLRVGGGSGFGFGEASSYGAAVVAGIEVAAGGGVDDLRIRLERPGTLKGRVVGSDGEPVAGASVFVRDASGRLLSGFSMSATDGEGRFRRAGIAPGEVTVSARLGEEVSPELGPVRVREDDETEVELTLDAGTILRVSVENAAGEPIRVGLSVRDEAGRDFSTLRSFDDMQAVMSEGFSTTEQRVGPLPPGTYVVTATTQDGESEERTIKLTGRSERKLRLRVGE